MRIVPWALLGVAGVVVATGVLPVDKAAELASTTGPVLIFVVAMTVVAELASTAGVFTVIAEQLAAWGRGRVMLLWIFVLIMVTLITAFMSLDTTAVLVTPIIVLLARHIGLSPLPFALATVWLANTASLFLPVSNLTNLLAADTFGSTPFAFVRALWVPALISVLITIGMLTVLHRGSLSGRYELVERTRIPDRPLLAVGIIVIALMLPLLVSGLPVSIVACGAALILVAAFAVRNRNALGFGLVPWRTIVFAGSLFVLVETVEAHGLTSALATASGSGEDVWSLLRLAALGALGANAVNNLPAFLAMSTVAETPMRMGALLVGVNLAPLVSPWASLATLLWHQRLERLGVEISWLRFAVLGLVLVVLIVPTTVLALRLS
ncbi:arsenical efflux pump membrane protein ArsB [Brevibacterium marinum]|nr:SLC13 family permease [Brevibacterium marinum]